jgi:hypothetical protein
MTAIGGTARNIFENPNVIASTSGTFTLTTAKFVSLINSSNNAHTCTVPSGRSRWVCNTSTTNLLPVSSTGQSVRNLRPGESIIVSWSASAAAHELHLMGTAVFDSGPSNGSVKPAESGGIKAQLDALEADIAAIQSQLSGLSGGGVTIAATAHGLVAADIGKPLDGSTIVDDVNSSHVPLWVLAEVIDANNIRVQMNGEISIDDALLEGGATYNLGTQGPYVYWDKSVGTYVDTLPTDSWIGMREILYILEISGGNFTAAILGWGLQS